MQYRNFRLPPFRYTLELYVSSKKRLALKACFLGASSMALTLAAPSAFAQTATDNDEIIVTGIRASLDRAQDLKRNSDGVVDGISAEDIGKFPDTNLAESLQRITGVSINRVNGEGSQVTVRGFSGDFNLVTLNGRTLPGADVPLAGTDRSGSGGNTRAFDFSNLASESVSGIQVYKTGKATLPSGGIGATINIETARPLDNPGLQASFSAKALHDSSVDTGSDITPELSGLVSWTDESEKFGIGLFGSYQKRDSAASASSVAGWQISTVDEFLANTGFVTPTTNLQNTPANGDQLIGVPFDSRFHFSELERERLNGQLVLQFAPSDNLTITGDVLYARNDNNETRSDISNWFGASFTEVVFDDSTDVVTPLLLSTVHDGFKDFAITADEVGTRDELTSFGVNFDWQATDNVRFVIDGHLSEAEVSPTLESSAIGGLLSRAEVGLAAPFVDANTTTFGPNGIPTQDITINNGPDGVPEFTLEDVSSTVANGITSTRQNNEVGEIDLKAIWETDDTSSFTAGVNYRAQENTTDQQNFQQFLGFWNAGTPGDVAEFAPGLFERFCLTCRFDDFDSGVADGSQTGISFRGSSNELFNALSPVFDSRDGTPEDFNSGVDNTLRANGSTFSIVEEDIFSIFASFNKDFTIADRSAKLNVGLRYEETDLTSTSTFNVPLENVFSSDNDNNFVFGGDPQQVAQDFSYSNLLPNIDLSVDVTDDIVLRTSYSQTIARAGFGNLVTNVSGFALPGQTFFGATPTASAGNPELLPLQSDNYDVSAEWYYGPSSFVTAGLFHKRVDNFLGSGSVEQSLFGLTDVFSGEPGTISGDALEIIGNTPGANVNQVNLFTLTRLIENGAANNVAQATIAADFAASINALTGDSDLFASVDGTNTTTDAGNPLLNFLVNQQINNNQGNITGIELSGQHFFGDTGFGIAGSYTYVDGDVDFDVNAPVGAEQFALTGISDTANITGIYEKYGLSARVSYNWRDTFLAAADRGNGNPLFVDAFGQFDANVSYDVTDNIAVSFEAINITGENLRTFTRSEAQLVFAQELAPRYLFGARYKF